MNARTFGLALALAAFSPIICNASPDTAAADACARALAARVAHEPAAAPRYKLDYRDSSYTPIFPTSSTFDLEAHDPKTRAVLARARCSTDTRGTVVALSLQPLGDEGVTYADPR
jgi:hypothetical protein